jgi:PAS domain-containing protein
VDHWSAPLHSEVFQLAGTAWRIEFEPAAPLWRAETSADAHLVVGFSVLLGFLVAFSVLVSSSRSAVLATQVAERTDELQRELEARRAAETALRQADEKLRQLNAELERRVEDRTAALGRSEARFNAFMQAMPALAWINDKEARLQYVNPAWEATFCPGDPGWSGKTSFDIFPPGLAQKFARDDRDALSSGQPVVAVDVPRSG